MASERMRAVVETMRKNKNSTPADLDIEQRRKGMELGMQAIVTPDDISVEPVDANGIPCRWIYAPEARSDRFVIYFHGGGYVMGSLHTHEELMSRISRHCKARVLGVDYRLAPEHPYPAAVNDGLLVYEWLLAQNIPAGNIMMGGDSAGGGLTLATLLAAKNKSISMPAGAILFSPWTDLTGSGESMITRAEADPMIAGGRDGLASMASLYHGQTAASDPLVSPLFGDLSLLPPLLIQVGDAEVLLSDSTRLADYARKHGVRADLQIWDEAPHVFQALPMIPEAKEALEKAGAFFEELIGSDNTIRE